MNTASQVCRLLAVMVASATWIAVPSVASAGSADWRPDRPIRFVVGGAPGGAFSTIALILAPKFQEALGQPWVLDNRGGRGGSIAAQIVASANPDGHTVLMLNGLMLTVRSQLYKELPPNIVPIGSLTRTQYLLVLNPSVAASKLEEFIALAKRERAGYFNYASTGVGAPTHLGAELLSARAGISMTQIPYKGGADAASGVIRGEAHLSFVALSAALPFVKEGRLKALAVSGLERSAIAPEIPTVAELGFPGFDVSTWYGLFVPAKTSEEVLRILQDATAKALKMPDVMEAITRLGFEIYFKRMNEVQDIIRNDTTMWAKVIKDAKIKVVE